MNSYERVFAVIVGGAALLSVPMALIFFPHEMAGPFKEQARGVICAFSFMVFGGIVFWDIGLRVLCAIGLLCMGGKR